MQTIQSAQTQTPDVLQQFSDMLKIHSIIVADRENLVKLFENIIELCTQMPKTKLKAAFKAATKDAAAAAKKAPAAKKTPATKKAPAAKKAPAVQDAVNKEEVVGPADAGVCPLESDIAKPAARGRGRPRKSASTDVVVGEVETPVGDAEKKKRGRPKKDKSVMISSNEDEDALIAKMIADVKSMKKSPMANASAETNDEGDETESDHCDKSVSPVPIHNAYETPMLVEADVSITKKVTKAPKEKVVKEKVIKEKVIKEKVVKEPKETVNKENVTKKTESPAPVAAPVVAAAIPVPVRENKAGRDGKFYLMSNFPRTSFSCSGKTYFRTETDNVYDNLTLELVGVWDHLNHEIVTPFDDEDIEELWSDQE
jgi:hypothetical protein